MTRTLPRLAGLLAALVAAVGVAMSPAAALTQDWTKGALHGNPLPDKDSRIYGSHAHVWVWAKGSQRSFESMVEDTAADGRCAVLRLRYQIYYQNRWVTHHRTWSTACGKGQYRLTDEFRSRYPTRALVMRACVSRQGVIETCAPQWS